MGDSEDVRTGGGGGAARLGVAPGAEPGVLGKVRGDVLGDSELVLVGGGGGSVLPLNVRRLPLPFLTGAT